MVNVFEILLVVIILKLNNLIIKRYFTRKKIDHFIHFIVVLSYIISKGLEGVIWQIAMISIFIIPIILIMLVSLNKSYVQVIATILLVSVLVINSICFDYFRTDITLSSKKIEMIEITHEGRREYITDTNFINTILDGINSNTFTKVKYDFRTGGDYLVYFHDTDKTVVDKIIITDYYYLSDGLFLYRAKQKLPLEEVKELLTY